MLRNDSCFAPLKYESLGRAVIPMGKAGDAKCPLVSWKQYQHKSPELDDLLCWQEEFSPTNWAMVCGGVSGIFVLDCDSKTSCQWAKSAGLEPAVETPHGLHFYFSSSGLLIGTTTLDLDGCTLEIKGEASLANFYGPEYVVQERALSPDGLYPLEALPTNLLRQIKEPRLHRCQKLPTILPRGERNVDLFSLARTMHWRGAHPDAIRAFLKTQNLYCNPPLNDQEVDRIALSAEKYQMGFTTSIEINYALTRLNLAPYQSRVFQAILLLCHGLMNRYQWISITLLSKITGIHKPHVSDAVQALCKLKLISRQGTASRIEICLNPPDWWDPRGHGTGLALPDRVTISTNSIPRGVSTSHSYEEMGRSNAAK